MKTRKGLIKFLAFGTVVAVALLPAAIALADPGPPLIVIEELFEGGTDSSGNPLNQLQDADEVAVSPDGAHVYVAADDDDAITVFSRNASTGVLTYVQEVTDGPGNDLQDLQALAISPDGAHVYVGGDDDAVVVFSRDAGTGMLTFVQQLTDNFMLELADVKTLDVSPDGAHVYVGGNDDAVSVFSRDAGTGMLTFVQEIVDTGALELSDVQAVAVSPDGAHVYAAGLDDGVTVFSRDAGTGMLTFVEELVDGGTDGSGNSLTQLNNLQALTVSPDGAHVYVGSDDDNAVTVFSRDAGTGVLTLGQVLDDGQPDAAGTTINRLNDVSSVAVSPDGAHLYVTSEDDDAVSVFGEQPIPEIDVQRPAGTSIPDGGADALGTQAVGTVILDYTIDNTAGTGQLDVTNATAANLTNVSAFAVNTGLPLNVAAGATATLQIQFDVDAAGAFSFDLAIANNDSDEDPYDIAVSGTGVTPEIDVQRPPGASIPDGGADALDNQGVGTVILDYTIDNTAGSGQLDVTNATAANLTNVSAFAVNTGLPLNVAAGATATLQIQFDVDGIGAFSFDLAIANNDSDEDPYDIAVSGTGVIALTVGKTYAPVLILPDGVDSSTLSIAITNPNTVAASNVAFSDAVSANLAFGATDTSSCAGATFTAGGGSLDLSLASLAAGTTCTVTVPVTSTTQGSYPNTVNVTSDDLAGASDSATLNVYSGLAIGKAFAPSTIKPGEISTLTFTINNASGIDATGVAFTDDLPAGVEVAAIPNATGDCNGGTFSAPAAATTVSLSGGALTNGSNCVLSVDVTAPLKGTYDNLTSAVTSNETPDGNQAAATLNVRIPKKKSGGGGGGGGGNGDEVAVLPAPSVLPELGPVTFIDKRVDKELAQVGDVVTYTIVANNPKDETLTEVVIRDVFDSRLDNVELVSSSAGVAGVMGDSLRVSGFELPPGQTATWVVRATISGRASSGDVILNQATLESPNASLHTSPEAITRVTAGWLPASGFTPFELLQRILPYFLAAGAVLLLLMMVSQPRRRAFR